MKNTKDKKIKLVGLTLACTLSVASLGSYIYDKNAVDHVNEECPFNKILGVSHQVNSINKDYDGSDIIAKDVKVIKTKVNKHMIDPIISYKKDGTEIINIPKGYDYYDRILQKCVKEEITKEPMVDKKGNYIYEKYIIVGASKYVDQDYVYDYEINNQGLKLIKLS